MSTATLKLHYRALHHKIQSRAFAIPAIRVPWKLIYVMAALVTALLMVFYVAKVDELTKGAYAIKNYTKEISSLSEENKALETQFAERDFLGSITQKAEALGFEKIGQVTYVQVLQNSLAQAK